MYPLPEPNKPLLEQQPQDNDLRSKVNKIIQDSVVWSMGAGLIPLPLMDVAAVTAIQMDMIRKICSLYKQDFSEMQAKAWISTLGGSVGSRLVAESAKFIPTVGQILGGVTMAILSGATTYGLGKVFSKHFESGGTFMNFDPEKFKSYFGEQYNFGKEYVLKLSKKPIFRFKKENQTKEVDNKDEVITKLRQLGDLRVAGILSEEEFQAIKQKLLAQVMS